MHAFTTVVRSGHIDAVLGFLDSSVNGGMRGTVFVFAPICGVMTSLFTPVRPSV